MKSKKKKKPLMKLLKKIYKIIDVSIVVPISTIVFKVRKKFGKDNRLEKILSRPYALLILSGIIALAFSFLVNFKADFFTSNDAEFLTNVPVRLVYNKSAYVVEGAPETVNITLIGKKAELYLARQLTDNEVVVDLTDYQASDKAVTVKLTYNKAIDNLEYQISPDYITVSIKSKVSDTKTITYDLLNQDDLDPKLSVRSVELSKPSVTVRGSQETIDSIASIKALIDLDNEDFTKAGTYTVENLKLVAYGKDGSIVDAEIVATNINAKVVLDSFSRRVKVKVETTGELVIGKAISSITIDGQNANDFETTIYGDEAALKEISTLTAYVNVSGQGNNGSKTYKVSIPKPAGVRSIAHESVSIVLNFGDESQRTITLKGIEPINKPNGLSVNIQEGESTSIEVQVKGVESALEEIDVNNPKIWAYVDLSGLGVGEYSVDVQVKGDDSRLSYVVTRKVDVILKN